MRTTILRAPDVETLGAGTEGTEKATVLIVSSDSGVSVRTIGTGSFLLGRSTEADVFIGDPSVSRKHARLTLGETITLEALRSRNGTSVLGRTLDIGETISLGVGTAFSLGFTTCIVQSVRDNVTFSATRARALESGQREVPGGAAATRNDGIVIADAKMRHLYGLLDVIGPSDLNVVVLGETGVGKDLYARAVHLQSNRADRPFLQLNCAALPDQLLEAELFGYAKGAFTGATETKPGLFESADTGTVFLDEIGELTLPTQAKLLRALESGEVRRIGSNQNRKVDVRFVAATNRDLRKRCAEGTFRADLFFRLNGMSITIPPLRERTSEIATLATTFVERAAQRLGRPPVEVTFAAIAMLQEHSWPGNVRELKNILERAFVLCNGQPLDASHLVLAEPESFSLAAAPPADAQQVLAEAVTSPPPSASPVLDSMLPIPAAPPSGTSLRAELEHVERARIANTLARVAGNQSQAARELGISRHTLMKRLDLYGIPRPRSGR